jgi:hypothetical protein
VSCSFVQLKFFYNISFQYIKLIHLFSTYFYHINMLVVEDTCVQSNFVLRWKGKPQLTKRTYVIGRWRLSLDFSHFVKEMFERIEQVKRLCDTDLLIFDLSVKCYVVCLSILTQNLIGHRCLQRHFAAIWKFEHKAMSDSEEKSVSSPKSEV